MLFTTHHCASPIPFTHVLRCLRFCFQLLISFFFFFTVVFFFFFFLKRKEKLVVLSSLVEGTWAILLRKNLERVRDPGPVRLNGRFGQGNLLTGGGWNNLDHELRGAWCRIVWMRFEGDCWPLIRLCTGIWKNVGPTRWHMIGGSQFPVLPFLRLKAPAYDSKWKKLFKIIIIIITIMPNFFSLPDFTDVAWSLCLLWLNCE